MVATLQRYENLVQIGTGSMGIVYRARDKVLDRDVALKMMRTGAGVDPDVRERFYREARACARLKHPNIVQVYDLGEDNDVAYIAMEYLHGADLRKVIEQQRRLTLPVQLQAMIDVCEALDHAHRHGVIHRDVKPSNLLLQEDNRVKVMDFGIARLTSSRLTMAGKILGTPNYMAPEQILGKPCDGRADLFSAAIVFFEFLTWAHPFQAEVILKRIVDGVPDSIFDHNVTVPVPLEKIISKGLSKEPEQRYASVAEMAADLRALLDAVRQNATPTMARMELPSERMLPHQEAAIAVDSKQAPTAPPGEDPAEWRLSEVLRLIPAFEEGIERNDRDAAADHLCKLRAIAGVDRRFVSAVSACEDAMVRKWPSERRSSGDVTRDAASAVSASVSHSSSVPSQAQPGSASPAPQPVKSAPPPRPQVNSHTASTQTTPHASTKLGWLQQLSAKLPRWITHGRIPGQTRTQTLIIAGTVAASLVLLLTSWLVKRALSGEALRQTVGVAVVHSGSAVIKAEALASAATIATVSRGQQVNLLEFPLTPATDWVLVQHVLAGRPQKPGYIKVDDLSGWQEWTVEDPQQALRFARLMTPPDSGSDTQLREYIRAAGDFSHRLPGPAAAELRNDVARISSLLADRQAARSPVVEAVVPAPDLQARPLDVPLSPKQQAAQQIEIGWKKFSNGEMARAKAYARRALQLEPENSEARQLLKEIKELESSSGPTQ